jgi:hypothetical protein
MFGPSLKSVPGCLVSMVPILIGVPVALTPGFEPHFETSTAPPLLEAVDVLLDAAPPLVLLLLALLLLLLLLPHPARTVKTTTATSATLRRTRTRAEWSDILTLSSPR